MGIVVKIGLAWYCFTCLALPCVWSGYLHPSRSHSLANGPGEPPAAPDVHGSILSSLLKALSEKGHWAEPTPRLKPDSRYVRYMKRIYRMSATHDREPKGSRSHLYNTVRLFTPRDECPEQSREIFTEGLSYNLDRVRAQEQLLKSVLLYSFDKRHVTPLVSTCHLRLKEQEHSDQQVCSSAQHSFSFHVQIERRSRRKWVEVDVTSFLQPLIRSHKKDIHMVVNLTCVMEGAHNQDNLDQRKPIELSFKPPSLLLYLNDTSELAYQRRSTSAKLSDTEKPGQGVESPDSGTQLQRQVEKRSLRFRRNQPKHEQVQSTPSTTTASLLQHYQKFEFPTDECELFDFRVSFSQLKLDHWIIAPYKYNPRYCKGVCPRAVGYRYGSPVHTMVQNIIYEKLDSSVPRPSCVPSDYNPLSVLTIENDGSIAYKEYEEMIATKCTCR
ncbi:growth/differentiatio [Amia ocellicauda]|uniref:growth/differentiatio n=1 Tax=Amia ocellicauda TaxID=2972642 RepID=UPI003463FAF5